MRVSLLDTTANRTIESVRWDDTLCVLVTEDGKTIHAGEILHCREGHEYIIRSGYAPHKPASTGRVYVTHIASDNGYEYYPSVLGLRWIPYEG